MTQRMMNLFFEEDDDLIPRCPRKFAENSYYFDIALIENKDNEMRFQISKTSLLNILESIVTLRYYENNKINNLHHKF